MKTPLRIACLLLLAGASSVSHASDATPSAPADTAPAPKPKSPSINIVFPGGSVAELVSVINASDNATFNLIGEKAHQEVILPPFSLRNADPASLAVALNGLLRPRELTLSLASPNIFVLTKNTSPSPSYAPPAPTFQAYQLAPYLPSVSVDDITDAISTAWAADAAHDAKLVRFKYHPATKLLFVYGPPEAITIATQLIPQLNPTATARARYEYLRSPSESLSPLSGSPAEEQARLDTVSQEVRRRREQREASKAVLPPLEKK